MRRFRARGFVRTVRLRRFCGYGRTGWESRANPYAEGMPTSPRLQQIEELLAADPDDEFLRYAQAMEHTSLGDDAGAVAHLQALIALNPAAPYIPAFLMCGQALLRLDREKDAAEVLRS